MIIAIDFDGTCVTHEYPKIGKDIGAVPVLKKLVAGGAQLILWTMRSGDQLAEAVSWFNENEISLWGIQSNPDQKDWTTSPKAYAQLYIDDAALGCPLIRPETGRPYVDWNLVHTSLIGPITKMQWQYRSKHEPSWKNCSDEHYEQTKHLARFEFQQIEI